MATTETRAAYLTERMNEVLKMVPFYNQESAEAACRGIAGPHWDIVVHEVVGDPRFVAHIMAYHGPPVHESQCDCHG